MTADMVEATLNGRWTLTLPRHRADRPDWYTAKGWERRRLDAMYDTIRPGDVIVDVGAEEGDMTALCASWAGPDGGMILAEPNPRVWPNIRAIWEHNPHLAPVLDWWVGFFSAEDVPYPPNDNVTNHAGMIDGWPECAYGDIIGDHGFRHLAEEADATPQVRLDTFMEDPSVVGVSVDVITMDVEGAEFEVLKGAYEILVADMPTVFVSIHPPPLWDLYATEPWEIHRWMEALGYVARYITTDHEEHWKFEHPDRETT